MMTISTLILISIVISGLASIFVYHLKRLNLYRAAAKMSGPMALPLIGNAHYFFGDSTDIIPKIMRLLDYYSSPARAWLGHKLLIVLSEPEQMKTILLSPKSIEKDELYRFIRPWLGTGLFSAPATKWRIHRKIIMPTFNSKILESFVEVFTRQSEIMAKQMEAELNSNELDVFDYVSLCTLDIICETAMGVPGTAQTDKDLTYIKASKRAFEIVYLRMLKLWLHPDCIFNRTQLARDQKTCIKYLHEQTNNVIRKKRAQSIDNCVNEASVRPTKKAFLDLLMELSKDGTKLTDEELREEVDTMMIAGNDTTATVNSFVIFMLANFPNIQQKCYDELLTIYGDEIGSNSPIKCEDLRRMGYIERVIKETMRLFPVGPLIVRSVSEDLQMGDYVLPKGCSAVLAIVTLHRRSDVWENPLEFDPDRFLPESVAKRHPYSYIPFSAGPRNCIGLTYAMMGMKVLIATVLRRYILKKDSYVKIQDIRIKADVILKPVDPITVKIEKRNK